MNDRQFGQILHDIAIKDIPDQPHGWSRVSAGMSVRGSYDERHLMVLRKLTAALLTALIVLFAGTAAYAFYQHVIETPWVQAILDAQMQTDLHLEQTLEVTLDVGPTPSLEQVQAAMPVVTATLTADELLTESAIFPIGPISVFPMPTTTLTAVVEWAYLDASRVAISCTLHGDPDVLSQYFVRPELTTVQGEMFGTGAMGMSTNKMVPGELSILASFDHDEQFQDGESLELRLTLKFMGVTSGWDAPDMQFVFDLPLVMQGEALYVEPHLSTVANGVTMTLQSVKIMPTMVTLQLCYELFGHGDWQFADTALYIGDYEGAREGGRMLGDKKALADLLASGQGTLCSEVTYSVGLGRDEVPGTFRYTVGRLQTSFPENPGPDVLERAHRRLAEKGIEVDFDFSGRGMRFEILSQPEGLETYEVNTFIFDSLSDWHEGPWIFEVDLSVVEPAP